MCVKMGIHLFWYIISLEGQPEDGTIATQHETEAGHCVY